MAKHDKDEVEYSKGKPNRHCGLCQHWLEPNRCTQVAGLIRAEMWCRLFEPRPAPQGRSR